MNPTALTTSDSARLDAVRTLRWPARKRAPAGLAGEHLSRVLGGAAEFTEYRAYRQGDEPGRIDWKLLARSDRVYIRLSRERTVLPTTLVVAASGSLAYPAASLEKWHCARRLTLGLAAAAQRGGDPVGLVVATANGPRRLPLRSRQGTVHDIARVLADVPPAGSPALGPIVAARLRDAADSLELVLVSPPVAAEAWDAATPAIRALWPGRITLVPVAPSREMASADANADAGARQSGAGGPQPPRLEWADSGATALWAARATPDTAGAVRLGDAVVVYPFVRRWRLATAVESLPHAGARVAARGPGAPAGLAVTLAETALPVEPSSDGWTIAFTLPDSAAALRLIDRVRTENRVLVLAPTGDASPTVQLLRPARDTTVRTPAGTLAFDARLGDDLGLRFARFEYIISSGEGEGNVTFRSGTLSARRFEGRHSRDARLQLTVPLATFQLQPGDLLMVRAIAVDGNTWSGPDTGYSETRTLRVARPGEYDSLAVEGAPPPADSALMTLRYLIQLTERLEASRPRLARKVFVDSSRGLGTRAERLRTRVQQLQADQTMGGMFPPNPLLNTAYLALAEGESSLKIAEPGEALPPLWRALKALQEYARAERYYLRGRSPEVLVDLARVRLAGTDKRSHAGRRAGRRHRRGPPGPGYHAGAGPGAGTYAGARTAPARRSGARQRYAASVERRMVTGTPAPAPGALPGARPSGAVRGAAGEFVFATAVYVSGDWESAPLLPANLIDSVARYTTIPVAPSGDARQGAARIALDTARYAAVVALDSVAARYAGELRRYVAAGGGLIVLGDAAGLAALAPLVPAAATGPPSAPSVFTRNTAAGGVPGDSRAALALAPLGRLKPGAVALETRRGRRNPDGSVGADVIAAAAWRLGQGRVVQIGYHDTWRWRMAGAEPDPVQAHRAWWAALVNAVAYAPRVPRNPQEPQQAQDLQPSPGATPLEATPLASFAATLGAPTPRPADAAGLFDDPRVLPLAFGVLLAALLLEWASRRLRGAR